MRGESADDLVQEVFLTALDGLAEFRRDRPGDTFRGWLRGITRIILLRHQSRAGREPRAGGGTDAHIRLREVPAQESAGAARTLPEDTVDPPEEVSPIHNPAA